MSFTLRYFRPFVIAKSSCYPPGSGVYTTTSKVSALAFVFQTWVTCASSFSLELEPGLAPSFFRFKINGKAQRQKRSMEQFFFLIAQYSLDNLHDEREINSD